MFLVLYIKNLDSKLLSKDSDCQFKAFVELVLDMPI